MISLIALRLKTQYHPLMRAPQYHTMQAPPGQEHPQTYLTGLTLDQALAHPLTRGMHNYDPYQEGMMRAPPPHTTPTPHTTLQPTIMQPMENHPRPRAQQNRAYGLADILGPD